MVAMVFLLLGAGSETTTHLISGSVFELLKNLRLRDWLEEDWSRGNLAIEEFLRFVSPVQFTKPRYVSKDVTLDSVRLKKGDKIMVMIAAANADPKAHEAAGRTVISPSALGSTSALATSSRGWKANARLRPCSSSGRNLR
jgi:cytochrome P450 PksS